MVRKRGATEGKFTGAFGGVSGIGSIISAHNVCHSVCLGVVAVLSVFGIIVSSNVLMFLEKYTLLFWGMGIFFLAMSMALYIKFGKCISTKLILFNAGLLIIGFPFTFIAQYALWIFGGAVSAASIAWFVKDKVGL